MSAILERSGPGEGTTSPLPSPIPSQLAGLSTGAQRLGVLIQQRGQVSDVEVRALLGAEAMGAVRALLEAWWIIELPGRGGNRAGRVATYVAVPQGNVPDVEVTLHDAEVLSGCSGMLSFFAGKLNLDAGQTLAAMRALVLLGLASGGPVGASFAFRVRDTRVE